MAASSRRYSQEFKNQLCEEVISTSKTIQSVAASHGIGDETLRSWLKKYREEHKPAATEDPVAGSERARLKELERENQELRAETAFLKKAVAYFAREPR
jgi:transposase